MNKRCVILKIKVSPQTAYHLRKMAAAESCGIGRVVDKMTRAWVLMLGGAKKI